MIVSNARKVGLLLNPRTGSKSLFKMFKDRVPTNGAFGITFAYPDIDNPIPLSVAKLETAFNARFDNFKIYGFYRDPVDRFLSMEAFVNRKGLPENRKWTLFHQHRYLDAPNVELLDFRNFENEVVRVMGEFGFTITPADVEHVVHPDETPRSRDELTGDELAEIYRRFRADYDFLASRGVAF